MRRYSATGRSLGPRINTLTPMIAGEEPGGRLWFAATRPISDLVEMVSGSRSQGTAFGQMLVRTPFAEVYTDQGQRPMGRHPGCCVVDLFTYALNLPSPGGKTFLQALLATHRVAAEWGQIPTRYPYDTQVNPRLISGRLEELIPAGMPPIQLIRFRIDEEGYHPGTTGWIEHAAQLLTVVLRVFYDRTQAPGVQSFSFPLRTNTGTFTFEGDIPFIDVARYFYDMPSRHFQGALGDMIPGGYAEGRDPSEFDPRELRAGIRVEMEHTRDPRIAREIAMDHLVEDPHYYRKLKKAGL